MSERRLRFPPLTAFPSRLTEQTFIIKHGVVRDRPSHKPFWWLYPLLYISPAESSSDAFTKATASVLTSEMVDESTATPGACTKDSGEADNDSWTRRILWSPETQERVTNPEVMGSENATLPPQAMMDDVLRKFGRTLSPQYQSVTTSSAGNYPKLAIYCPLENANYVVDGTVKELARQAGADVVVIDSVHLAAQSHGDFSNIEGEIKFNGQRHPLRFKLPPPAKKTKRSRKGSGEEADSGDDGADDEDLATYSDSIVPSSLFEGCSCPICRPGNTKFFQDLVNIGTETDNACAKPIAGRRPRIVESTLDQYY